MQTISSTDLSFDIPPFDFPAEATEAPAVPLQRKAMSRALADTASTPNTIAATPAAAAELVALRIARAIAGETELRLLAKREGDVTTYIIRKSVIATFANVDTTMKGGKKMTESRAREGFDKLVADTYPPETLRNNKVVQIYQNVL